jgi:hypothetical protein
MGRGPDDPAQADRRKAAARDGGADERRSEAAGKRQLPLRRLRIVSGHEAEQGRLAITPCRRALRFGAAIVFQHEQGKLAALRGAPRFKLGAAQFDEALPA